MEPDKIEIWLTEYSSIGLKNRQEVITINSKGDCNFCFDRALVDKALDIIEKSGVNLRTVFREEYDKWLKGKHREVKE